MNSLLLIKLASMGDLIHMLPAIQDLSIHRPEVSLHWMVDTHFQEIPSWHPFVRHKIITNHRSWRSSLFSSQTWRELQQVRRELSTASYDFILDAHGNYKTAWLSTWNKADKGGFDAHSIPEWGAHFFYDKRYAVDPSLHAIDRLRILMARAMNYPIPTTELSYGITISSTLSWTLPPLYRIFVPIASRKEKLWTNAAWKALIHNTPPIPLFIPWGNNEEYARAKELCIAPFVSILPKMSLSHLALCLQKAQYVISLDTGLSHIAAALGTPCVTLYGPTNPKHIGTRGQHQLWVQHNPLSSLSTETVLKVSAPWILR